jgi:hypothetical protein
VANEGDVNDAFGEQIFHPGNQIASNPTKTSDILI